MRIIKGFAEGPLGCYDVAANSFIP